MTTYLHLHYCSFQTETDSKWRVQYASIPYPIQASQSNVIFKFDCKRKFTKTSNFRVQVYFEQTWLEIHIWIPDPNKLEGTCWSKEQDRGALEAHLHLDHFFMSSCVAYVYLLSAYFIILLSHFSHISEQQDWCLTRKVSKLSVQFSLGL